MDCGVCYKDMPFLWYLWSAFLGEESPGQHKTPPATLGKQATSWLSFTMYFKDFCSQETVLNKQKSILNHEVGVFRSDPV